MKCTKCGKELPASAKFCPVCGQKSGNRPSFCMHCGSVVADDMKFCENCGKPIEELPSEKPETSELSVEDAAEKAEEIAGKLQGVSESCIQGEEIASAYTAQAEGSAHTESLGSAAAPVQAETPVRAPASVHSEVAAQATPVSVEAAPIQTQTTPAAPHIPIAPVAPAASASASVAAEVAHAAGSVAAAGVKKAGSTAKTVGICALVVAFLIGAATACLNFFVPAPEDTVDKLITSVEELNYDDMLSCFDSSTEKQIRAVMGITGDLMGSLTGISIDLEDLMAFAPSMAPYLEIPDLGIAKAETVLYADCSKAKIMAYCETANSGGSIPTGYLSDNSIISFLSEYNLTLSGLENLIAETAIVKITLNSGEVCYLPLINEGWGNWRIPMMDLVGSMVGEE